MAIPNGLRKEDALKLCELMAQGEQQTHYAIRMSEDEFGYAVLSQDEKDEAYPDLEFVMFTLMLPDTTYPTPYIEAVSLY